MAQKKWYVVWVGRETGVFDSWQECKQQIDAYPGAKYKGYPSQQQALLAYEEGYDAYKRNRDSGIFPSSSGIEFSQAVTGKDFIANSYSVDAACSGNPGAMEYRGVYTHSHTELFRVGPMMGTNNIGEFLAIVHILALQKKERTALPVYSDSLTAISWVRGGKCRTKLLLNEETKRVHELIRRAEKWLAENPITVPIIKWNTNEWGEIPADFGRK